MKRDTISCRVGAFEAKTHLSSLLERVRQGEVIEITRRGTTIAKLVPAGDRTNSGREAAIAELKRFAKVHKLAGLSLKKMIAEGRR